MSKRQSRIHTYQISYTVVLNPQDKDSRPRFWPGEATPLCAIDLRSATTEAVIRRIASAPTRFKYLDLPVRVNHARPTAVDYSMGRGDGETEKRAYLQTTALVTFRSFRKVEFTVIFWKLLREDGTPIPQASGASVSEIP